MWVIWELRMLIFITIESEAKTGHFWSDFMSYINELVVSVVKRRH